MVLDGFSFPKNALFSTFFKLINEFKIGILFPVILLAKIIPILVLVSLCFENVGGASTNPTFRISNFPEFIADPAKKSQIQKKRLIDIVDSPTEIHRIRRLGYQKFDFIDLENDTEIKLKSMRQYSEDGVEIYYGQHEIEFLHKIFVGGPIKLDDTFLEVKYIFRRDDDGPILIRAVQNKRLYSIFFDPNKPEKTKVIITYDWGTKVLKTGS